MNSPFDILLEPEDKKSLHVAPVKLNEISGKYKIGPPTRPPMAHDNGFLGHFPKRPPTVSDRMKYAQWVAMLEGSEALCSRGTSAIAPPCFGEDLSDANAAYRHFLYGKGADRMINYERFLLDDAAGRQVIPNILNDFRLHIEVIGHDRVKFSVTSEAYTVGNNGIAPYPTSVNWQRALGAHYVWVSADVSVSTDADSHIHYTANVTFHVEDRFNFNPGQQDIASGIPDSANGIFEITGLAQQYMNYASVQRTVSWREGEWANATRTGAPNSRQRKPGDNRRVRNRI